MKVSANIAVDVTKMHVAMREENVFTYSFKVTVAIIVMVMTTLVKYMIAAM